ncbi:microfibrillar-associated protein 5 [Anolis sagrei]|uniref:microfibrillar-associated protein 5 n=1 Tax=Anolis sagrei TaxID=38937 RepID=UPI003521A584
MRVCGGQMLLCLIALAVLPFGVLNQDPTDDPVDTLGAADPGETAADEKGDVMTPAPDCHEEQFPCTRLYSVRKPVKQCISYLCVTSIRRTYMINKEICSRIVCKEDEAMQEEICRQMAGLPPRRLRRSGHPQGPLCRRKQQQKALDAQ